MDDEFLADDDAAEPRHPLRRAAVTLLVLLIACSLVVWQIWPGASLLFTRSIFRGGPSPDGLAGSPRDVIPELVAALQRSDAGPVEQALGRRLASGELEQLRAIVVPYS